jgi:hypothetical protein
VKTEPARTDGPARTDPAARPGGRRWTVVAVNVLLVVVIIALLAATWMPAIYDRLSTTKPSP